MAAGLLLAFATGIAWTIIGIAMSRCAKKGVDFPAFFALNYFATLLLALALNVNWRALVAGEIEAPWRLLAFGLTGGFVNAIGLLLLQKAMKSGHNGTSWAIGQSSMVIPFLAGALLFSEPAGALRWTGAALVVLGILLPSAASWRGASQAGKGWLPTTLSAFALLGVSMAIINAPSYWQGWHDNGNLRAALCYGGGLLPLLAAANWKTKGPFGLGRTTTLFALGMGVLNVVAAALLFAGLDLLAKCGAGSIAYPLMIGSCIAGFSLYSLLVIREKGGWSDWAGLSATIAGMAAMAF